MILLVYGRYCVKTHLYILWIEWVSRIQGRTKAARMSQVKTQARAKHATRGSQISLADNISSNKLAGKHKLDKGIPSGERPEDQWTLRTKNHGCGNLGYNPQVYS